jgi:hypothetical protein
MEPTLAEQAACCEREVGMRERVYPKWIQSGRMKAAEAQREIDRMRAAAKTLRALADREKAAADLFGSRHG